MSVQKIAELTTKVMTKAKALPTVAKLGLALGGVGLIFSAVEGAEKLIIGDNFEKTTAELSYSSNIKPGANPDNFKAIKTAEMLEQSGKGNPKVEKYDNGNIKSKKYYDDGIEVNLYYDEGGCLESSFVNVRDKNICQYDSYYSNGNLASSNDHIKNADTKYREDGTLESYYRYKMCGYNKNQCHEKVRWYPVEEIRYYPNGKMESRWVEDEDKNKVTTETFYDNGNRKTYTVTKNGSIIKEKEYDENGKRKT